MRVVLRVEVEAVKFLKEEPQRLDGLLKRCRGVTDTLAQIRRSFCPWPLTSDLRFPTGAHPGPRLIDQPDPLSGLPF